MEIIITFAVSFLATLISTPLVIMLAKKHGLVDDPAKRPHPANTHKGIVPRAGGLAIYIGIFISSLVFLPLQKYLVGILAGITLLLITGLIDDKAKTFSPYLRLIILFLAAGLAVFAGIGISFMTNPFSSTPSFIRLDEIAYTFNFFGTHNLVLIADLFALLWIVTITQVINWSKGVDGQMPGITLITALVLGFLSIKFYNQGDLNQLNFAKLAFITAGASGAFLIFNWHPSKILPGFSGSTILAYMLAVLAILSGAKVATALLALAIPTIDFVYTIFRRVKSGKSPVWGDRGHLHHKLLDLGWSHAQISLFYVLGSGILGAVALLFDTQSKVFATVVVAVIFIGFILWFNSFGVLRKQPDQDNG